MILDEPFSGFDPVNANLIKEEIFELRDKGATVIFSTHRMESVEQLCDHIALINKSQKILDGSKKEIKDSFKSHKYSVSYKGELVGASANFSTNTNQVIDDLNHSIIQANNSQSPNEVLQELINKVEVHSFIEEVPSVNDIFIQIVEEVKNETDILSLKESIQLELKTFLLATILTPLIFPAIKPLTIVYFATREKSRSEEALVLDESIVYRCFDITDLDFRFTEGDLEAAKDEMSDRVLSVLFTTTEVTDPLNRYQDLNHTLNKYQCQFFEPNRKVY